MRDLGTVEATPSPCDGDDQPRGPPADERAIPESHGPDFDPEADAQGDLRKQNEEVASKLRHGKIVHIEGAGHNVRRENKAQTLEVMRAFLAGT